MLAALLTQSLADSFAASAVHLALSMFKINPAPTFTCDVFLSRPDEDRPVKLRATFRHKTQREIDAWSRGVERSVIEQGAPTGEVVARAVVDALAEVVVELGPLAGPDGSALPYSRQVLEQLLDQFPSAAPELARQYRARLTDARAGN